MYLMDGKKSVSLTRALRVESTAQTDLIVSRGIRHDSAAAIFLSRDPVFPSIPKSLY